MPNAFHQPPTFLVLLLMMQKVQIIVVENALRDGLQSILLFTYIGISWGYGNLRFSKSQHEHIISEREKSRCRVIKSSGNFFCEFAFNPRHESKSEITEVLFVPLHVIAHMLAVILVQKGFIEFCHLLSS